MYQQALKDYIKELDEQIETLEEHLAETAKLDWNDDGTKKITYDQNVAQLIRVIENIRDKLTDIAYAGPSCCG